jgi:hypothetical protein
MKKKRLNVLFLVTFCLFSALPAFGWDDVGHKITAYIAWQQMTPDVRERVIALLRTAPEDSQLARFTFLTATGRTGRKSSNSL